MRVKYDELNNSQVLKKGSTIALDPDDRTEKMSAEITPTMYQNAVSADIMPKINHNFKDLSATNVPELADQASLDYESVEGKLTSQPIKSSQVKEDQDKSSNKVKVQGSNSMEFTLQKKENQVGINDY